MKGKTKTILAIALAVAIVAVAAVGTVTFLKDNGEASAAETESDRRLPVAGSDERTDSGEQANLPENSNEGDGALVTENVGTVQTGETARTTETTTTTTGIRTTTTTPAVTPAEPEVSTVEQERLVSQTLNWSNIELNSNDANIANKTVNYTNLKYTVNYIKVENDEEILLNTETNKAQFGTIVTVSDEDIETNCPEGYILDEKSELSVEIKANETENIINVYYIINSYTLTVNYVYEDGTEAAATYTHDYDYNSNYSVTSPVITGYTADIEVVAGTMPAKNVNVKVTYKVNKYNYTVEHWYEGLNGKFSQDENVENEEFKADYGTVIKTFTPHVITGYSLAYVTPANSENNKTAELLITENAETNVIKVYYTRNSYKVTYFVDGTQYGEIEEHSYGDQVTIKEEPTKLGYIFSGWSKEEDFVMPANDVEIRGTFTADPNTAYKVEHYLEKVDGSYKLEETEDKTGTTGTAVNAEAKTFEGFTFDDKVSGTKLSGTVAADGSLVLKLYYTRNSYTLTINYIYENGNTAAETLNRTLKHGDTYSVTSPTVPGYAADKTVVSGTMPKENVTVTVTYKKNPVNVTIKANTETTTITNSNIVVVIDTSYSMNYVKCPYATDLRYTLLMGYVYNLNGCKNHDHMVLSDADGNHEVYHKDETMMNAAKTVTNGLIDKVKLSNDPNKVTSKVSVIKFNGKASEVGTATTSSEIAGLKNAVSNMTTDSGTNMPSALEAAKTKITELSKGNNNQNIVIFLSDGESTMGGVNTAASALKGVATVYSIGFGDEADVDTLKNVIATDKGKYYTATADLSSLSSVFTKIENEISDTTTTATSVNNKVELPNIDMSKTITLKVNGTVTTYNIVEESGKHYLDVSNFLSTDKIVIEYFTK